MNPRAEVYTIQGRGMEARWASVGTFARLSEATADARARNLRSADARGLTLHVFSAKHGWRPGWFMAAKAGKDGQNVY